MAHDTRAPTMSGKNIKINRIYLALAARVRQQSKDQGYRSRENLLPSPTRNFIIIRPLREYLSLKIPIPCLWIGYTLKHQLTITVVNLNRRGSIIIQTRKHQLIIHTIPIWRKSICIQSKKIRENAELPKSRNWVVIFISRLAGLNPYFTCRINNNLIWRND